MSLLLAVAHGSRDPRSAATMSELVDVMRRQRPDQDMALAFLDLSGPRVPEALATTQHQRIAVVPLLLGSAFHARVDLPQILRDSARPGQHVTQAATLGADPRMISALRRRVLDTGVDRADPHIGVVFAAVGSSDTTANAHTVVLADQLAAGTAWQVRAGFATPTVDSVHTAIGQLRREGARRVVVAPWFLAPGLLWDRVCAAVPDAVLAEPLGGDERVAATALARFDAVCLPLLATG